MEILLNRTEISNLSLTTRIISESYTIQSHDCIILVNAASPITITLCPEETRFLIIKDMGQASENPITISAPGCNIDGNPEILLNVNYESVTLIKKENNWFIL